RTGGQCPASGPGGVGELSPAILVLVRTPAAREHQGRLETGVLAFGPRAVPTGSGAAAASVQPRQETMPYYILGLRDGLEKLNYVDVGNEKAGQSGRRVNLDLRMGTFQELRGYARQFARKPVDLI